MRSTTSTAWFVATMLVMAVCTSQGFATPTTPPLSQAPDVVVGVGFVFAPYNLPPDEQETILGQMEHAGVRVVRCSLSTDDKGLEFVQRVYAHKIKII
jgi:hypothetical protein